MMASCPCPCITPHPPRRHLLQPARAARFPRGLRCSLQTTTRAPSHAPATPGALTRSRSPPLHHPPSPIGPMAQAVTRTGSLSTADVSGETEAEEQAEVQVELLVHYHREKGDYSGWGLHVWGDVSDPTDWGMPIQAEPGWRDGNGGGRPEETFGALWVVPCVARRSGAGQWQASVNMLPHRWDEKDCTWTFCWEGAEGAVGGQGGGVQVSLWLVQGRGSQVFITRPDLASLPLGSLDTARAMWLERDVVAVDWAQLLAGLQANLPGAQVDLCLHGSRTASLSLEARAVQGADLCFPLTLDPQGLPDSAKLKFPHLASFTALRLPQSIPVEDLVQCELAVSCCAGGKVQDATAVQVTGVLDDCFFYQGPLGVSVPPLPPTSSGAAQVAITLWAPTAQSVELLLYDEPHDSSPVDRLPLAKGSQGQWTAQGPAADWLGLYYQYELLVYHPISRRLERCRATDPYSRGLSANGERSLIVDLVSKEAQRILEGKGLVLEPQGWHQLHEEKPPLHSFADISLYELHVRDFSACDETVDASLRGTYLAFAQQASNGVRHLKALSEAGLSHVHLLPTYDFASVNEVKGTWKAVDEGVLRSYPPDSEEQQAAVAAIQDADGFNWGYDPVHWGVPDGSYATNPDGPARTLEHRTMVQALNRLGLRVVLDVVYNHLYASGPHSSHSVLDKVVPGYYLRRAVDGLYENSTCCNNTASEHLMVERLIVDDLLMWATVYKVDGFRFDLMGHIMMRTLMKAREALNALTVEKDGVDGTRVYMYGEGWDFGEVKDNGRGVNGAQANLANTGIGSFNDRLRDSLLGGSPFGDPQQQGFLTGLFLQPNAWEKLEAERRHLQGSREWLEQLKRQADWIQLAIAGNLRSFAFTSHSSGVQVRGDDVRTIDGSAVAYAAQPCETINYISAHDNETLFDIVNLKASEEASGKDRMDMCRLGLSLLALSQGVPFFHAGDEMFRSKSLDRDSYNSGDWFNRLDFSYATNNFGVGLPMRSKNGEKWELMKPILHNSTLAPTSTDILASVQHFQLMLRIRYSSPLFRLQSAEEISKRVSFLSPAKDPAVPPGVIIVKVVDGSKDSELEQLDDRFKCVVTLINVRPDACSISIPELNKLEPHPLLVTALGIAIDAQNITLPLRSSLVLVEKR